MYLLTFVFLFPESRLNKGQTMFEMIKNPEVLDKIFSYLRDPASVKAVSLVSR